MVLVPNASSRSTKVFEYPHRKNDSMFTTTIQQFIDIQSQSTLTLTKMNTFMSTLICFPFSFLHALVSSHSRSKRVISTLVIGLSVRV